MSALDELRAVLEAEVERATRPALDAIAGLRAALDALERSIREEAEASVTMRAASGAGVAVPAHLPDHRAKRSAVDAMRALAAQLELAPGSGEPATAETPGAQAIDSPAEPVTPAAEPVTPEQLRAWLAEAREPSPPRSVSSPTEAQRERQTLRSLLDRVGAPPTLDGDVAIIDELDRLDEVSAEEQLARWATLTLPTQRLWVAFLVARGRALREAVASMPSLRARLREVLVRFPTFAATTRPGFINGMSPDHGPHGASWSADAWVAQEELRQVAALDSPLPMQGGATAPKKKPRRNDSAPAADDGDLPTRVAPALRSRCVGLRALLFGGTPREDARANIEAEMGFAELQWPESEKPRRLDAIVASVRHGHYDVVLITRLVRHAESNRIVQAARDVGTPMAFIESGYGVDAVSQAVATAFDGTPARSRHAS